MHSAPFDLSQQCFGLQSPCYAGSRQGTVTPQCGTHLAALALALSLGVSYHQWTELITRACTLIEDNLFPLTVGRLQVISSLPRSKSANLARHSSVEPSNTWTYFKVEVGCLYKLYCSLLPPFLPALFVNLLVNTGLH